MCVGTKKVIAGYKFKFLKLSIKQQNQIKENNMAKGKDSQKAVKKVAGKSLKEKRNEKKAKKANG